MSKVKKYSLIIVSILILLIAISNKSYAEVALESLTSSGANLNNTVTLSEGLTDLEGSNFLYCIQHGTHLSRSSITYTIKEYIEILGNKATVYSATTGSREVKNTINGKMAYIFSQGGGYGSVGNYTNTQRAIWRSFNSWVSTLGLSAYRATQNTSSPAPTNSIETDAANYANSLPENIEEMRTTSQFRSNKKRKSKTYFILRCR